MKNNTAAPTGIGSKNPNRYATIPAGLIWGVCLNAADWKVLTRIRRDDVDAQTEYRLRRIGLVEPAPSVALTADGELAVEARHAGVKPQDLRTYMHVALLAWQRGVAPIKIRESLGDPPDEDDNRRLPDRRTLRTSLARLEKCGAITRTPGHKVRCVPWEKPGLLYARLPWGFTTVSWQAIVAACVVDRLGRDGGHYSFGWEREDGRGLIGYTGWSRSTLAVRLRALRETGLIAHTSGQIGRNAEYEIIRPKKSEESAVNATGLEAMVG